MLSVSSHRMRNFRDERARLARIPIPTPGGPRLLLPAHPHRRLTDRYYAAVVVDGLGFDYRPADEFAKYQVVPPVLGGNRPTKSGDSFRDGQATDCCEMHAIGLLTHCADGIAADRHRRARAVTQVMEPSQRSPCVVVITPARRRDRPAYETVSQPTARSTGLPSVRHYVRMRS